jgi:hypothetical protein
MAFELDQGQGEPMAAFARRVYPGASVGILRDGAGLERVLRVRLAA